MNILAAQLRLTLPATIALLLAGCGAALTGPTKQIESPPQERFYTSIPAPGEVAQVAYNQPIRPSESSRLKAFDEWTEKDTAADALGRIGPPAVPALIQALHSQDAEVRLKAVEVLARMGPNAKEGVPELVLLLDDPDERIRKATTRTLGRIGPEAAPAVPALMRSLLQAEPSPPAVELQPVPME